MKRVLLLLVLAMCSLPVVLANGCGGPGGSALPISGEGEITSSDPASTNGAHYDLKAFHVSEDCTVAVSMQSSQVNCYVEVFVLIYDGDDYHRVDVGSSSSGYMTFPASSGIKYEVKFSTDSADDFGTYSYGISQVGGSYSTITADESDCSAATAELAAGD